MEDEYGDETEIKDINGNRKSSLTRRGPSGLRKQTDLEKIKKQRVPDSEHLSRMRALLVNEHQNDAFIHQLASGNSYIPVNLDPEGSREMGASFGDLYKRSSIKL